MIYSIFSNPSFINALILALLIFLILFLWRKIMILEGNVFILDKRVNLLKKDNRETVISHNIKNAKASMEDIFGGSCDDADSCCFMPSVPKVATIATVAVMSDNANVSANKVPDNNDVQISFTNQEQDSMPDDIIAMIEGTTETVVNQENRESQENQESQDTMSVASEITFDSNNAKYSQKKLSKMNLEKLKDVCTSLNINAEGTKPQLISRILENK